MVRKKRSKTGIQLTFENKKLMGQIAGEIIDEIMADTFEKINAQIEKEVKENEEL